jgi:hypothetical protein
MKVIKSTVIRNIKKLNKQTSESKSTETFYEDKLERPDLSRRFLEAFQRVK